MPDLINVETGEAPTHAEHAAIIARAIAIFTNPYASPEQMEWAIAVHPEGFALAFHRWPMPWEGERRE